MMIGTGKSTRRAATVQGTGIVAPPAIGAARMGTFASLKIRDYGLLWWGMVISNIGTWMQMVAQGYLVYQMTDSPFALGLVGFTRAVPIFTFSLFAGVVADRVDRRKLLIVTQTLAGVFALVLAVLTSTGVITVWMIMVIAFFSSAVAAFDNPTRQALVPDIVGKEYIANAVALQSAAFNGTGVLGPSLAGLALGFVGISACFYINAISFLAVIIALFMMSSIPNRTQRKATMIQNLREGFGYVRGNRVVAALLIQMALVGLLGRPYTQMMPAVQRDVLHVGATGLGLLMAFSSVGALIGALAIASLSDFSHRGLMLIFTIAAFGAGLIAFSSSRSFALSLGLLVIVGGGATMSMSTTNMLIQLNVPAEFRGRIMSMYTMIAMGTMPLGSMILGSVASFIGVPETLAFGGVGCIAALVLINLWIPSVRSAT
jgi:MFS family permease